MQNLGRDIAQHFYAMVVDKGPKDWLWRTTKESLRKEKYIQQTDKPQQVIQQIASLIAKEGTLQPGNPTARLCVLYSGKAKSLHKGSLMWRPIMVYWEPQIRKCDLLMVARAYTCFWQNLITDISNSFQVLRVKDVAAWLDWVNKSGLTAFICITKLDCKFNKVQTGWIQDHMTQSIGFLAKCKRWCVCEIS